MHPALRAVIVANAAPVAIFSRNFKRKTLPDIGPQDRVLLARSRPHMGLAGGKGYKARQGKPRRARNGIDPVQHLACGCWYMKTTGQKEHERYDRQISHLSGLLHDCGHASGFFQGFRGFIGNGFLA